MTLVQCVCLEVLNDVLGVLEWGGRAVVIDTFHEVTQQKHQVKIISQQKQDLKLVLHDNIRLDYSSNRGIKVYQFGPWISDYLIYTELFLWLQVQYFCSIFSCGFYRLTLFSMILICGWSHSKLTADYRKNLWKIFSVLLFYKGKKMLLLNRKPGDKKCSLIESFQEVSKKYIPIQDQYHFEYIPKLVTISTNGTWFTTIISIVRSTEEQGQVISPSQELE